MDVWHDAELDAIGNGLPMDLYEDEFRPYLRPIRQRIGIPWFRDNVERKRNQLSPPNRVDHF